MRPSAVTLPNSVFLGYNSLTTSLQELQDHFGVSDYSSKSAVPGHSPETAYEKECMVFNSKHQSASIGSLNVTAARLT